jgi:hypothetical protein
MVPQYNDPHVGPESTPPGTDGPSGQSSSIEEASLHLNADHIPSSTLLLAEHTVPWLSRHIKDEITRRIDHGRAYSGFCQKNFSPMADEERKELARGLSSVFPGFNEVEIRAATSDPAHTAFGRERELISVEPGLGGKPKLVFDEPSSSSAMCVTRTTL